MMVTPSSWNNSSSVDSRHWLLVPRPRSTRPTTSTPRTRTLSRVCPPLPRVCWTSPTMTGWTATSRTLATATTRTRSTTARWGTRCTVHTRASNEPSRRLREDFTFHNHGKGPFYRAFSWLKVTISIKRSSLIGSLKSKLKNPMHVMGPLSALKWENASR